MVRNFIVLILSMAIILSVNLSFAKSNDPDFAKYQGILKEIIKKGDVIEALRLDSDEFGEYVFNVNEETLWIDSAQKSSRAPMDLKIGENLNIYHSEAVTLSLPPQSYAYVVVSNIPKEMASGIYMVVDKVEKYPDGTVKIKANKGAEEFSVNKDTTYSSYLTRNIVTLDDINSASKIVTWYSFGFEKKAWHIMVLPSENTFYTRGEFLEELYKFHSDLYDVKSSTTLKWAQEQKILRGYSTDNYGLDDLITMEQMITMLHRYYGEITPKKQINASDKSEISPYALEAMNWAYENNLLDLAAQKKCNPQAYVSINEIANIFRK